MISFWPEKKYKLVETGYLKGMTEIHAHLLPGVDDGVRTAEESYHLLDYMENEIGVGRVRITPHTMTDYHSESANVLLDKFLIFHAKYDGNMSLSLSSEYMLDTDFPKRLKEGVLPLGYWRGDKLLLVETYARVSPIGFDGLITSIFHAGYIPVIAHPERYAYMEENDYESLKRCGCLFQLNAPSLTGYYGSGPKRWGEKLLDEGKYDFVGFDIHRLSAYMHHVDLLKLSRKRLDAMTTLIHNNNTLSFDE